MNYILEKGKVGLTRPRENYLEKYLEWINDMRVNAYLGNRLGQVHTLEEEEEWYEDIKDQEDTVIFTIHDLSSGTPIGNCSFTDIDHMSNRAEVGILIGEEEYRSRGYGTTTLELLLDYGFTALNLASIRLGVMEGNERARACYEKVGFREAGRLRKFYLVGGEYQDLILMDILREEFTEKYESIIQNRYLNQDN
ncbi:GNAT family N-acetyltransferase [Candidatus Bipolaricaulota bacterium]|nr:GNAT family N-acetyltransferase [Candidatus Bipolaricaulota bacterium]